jgi:EpsI family protein
MAKKNQVILGLMLILLVGILVQLGSRARQIRYVEGSTVADLPREVGGLVGEELPLSVFEEEQLESGQNWVLQRRFGDGPGTVWLAAVQSQMDWRSHHSPEVCYIAQGWRIDAKGRRTLFWQDRKFQVARMLVTMRNDRRLVYTFYTDGIHTTSSFLVRIGYVLMDQIFRAQIRSWLMVRVSTPYQDAEDIRDLSLFAAEIYSKCMPEPKS